jgi:microcompartment protein CcmL/EutN
MGVESLGMIEVRGFLGAVVAADSALKAAEVYLQAFHITRGGLVTVLLTGDVAAVNAGVDAGVASVDNFGCLISKRVIARLDSQTVILTQPNSPARGNEHGNSIRNESSTLTVSEQKLPAVQENGENDYTRKQNATKNSSTKQNDQSSKDWVTDAKGLERMRVIDLRKQAYQMNIKTLTKKQIKMGTKRVLIQAILKELQRRDNT